MGAGQKLANAKLPILGCFHARIQADFGFILSSLLRTYRTYPTSIVALILNSC